MTYKEELTAAMDALASDPANCFVGYGLRKNGGLGTLKSVPPAQLEEFPVAENLMAGAAIGLSLAGKKPVLYVERMDFVLNAADAIVNHLNAMAIISHGEFTPAVIIRVTVGNKTKPLFTGHTHTQNFAEAFRSMVSFPVVELHTAEMIAVVYARAREAQNRGESTMIVEFKDFI